MRKENEIYAYEGCQGGADRHNGSTRRLQYARTRSMGVCPPLDRLPLPDRRSLVHSHLGPLSASSVLPPSPMSKSKSKQQQALQFLDDLDNLAPPSADGPPPPASVQGASTEGEAEVFAFIDEITQKSSEPSARPSVHIDRPLSRAGTPTVRKSTERVKVGTPTPLLPGAAPLSRTESSSSRVSVGTSSRTDTTAPAQEALTLASASVSGGGGWGWGSVWSTASTALQQARSVVDEQVKNLPKNEQARKWGEGVLEYAKNAQLDKLGASRCVSTLQLQTPTRIRWRY